MDCLPFLLAILMIGECLHMKLNRVFIYSTSAILIFGILVALVYLIMTSSFLRQFQSFSLTINNQSDYDIVSVEAGTLKTAPSGKGTVEGDSKDSRSKVIKSGEVVKFKPRLSLTGEGGIYFQYTDSRGQTVKKGVCGYTESLSGYSNVTIKNDQVVVEGKCS